MLVRARKVTYKGTRHSRQGSRKVAGNLLKALE